jgi:3-methyladenine DNA glycosylase Mpg
MSGKDMAIAFTTQIGVREATRHQWRFISVA